ncbi:hypothetical protein [Hymenobacter fodinae]|uniref:Uncharacterized protein n=1 Tax=Hymenobacter fodinae TaxID=2510796 RepID=A0A4Z0P5B3_9BACT|nr:hypothetical protein [Hymenobacter fodinae]TGE05567.1 hypothetical protein EU556_19905 [Hymenobacter fodinae]
MPALLKINLPIRDTTGHLHLVSFKMTRQLFEVPSARITMLRDVLQSYGVTPPEDVELTPISEDQDEYTAVEEYAVG